MIVLDADMTMEASDGSKRRFVPGDVLLLEDTFGKGHKTWITKGRRTAVIQLG